MERRPPEVCKFCIARLGKFSSLPACWKRIEFLEYANALQAFYYSYVTSWSPSNILAFFEDMMRIRIMTWIRMMIMFL
eukprot:1799707-Karenia_brevis.AAC.1